MIYTNLRCNHFFRFGSEHTEIFTGLTRFGNDSSGDCYYSWKWDDDITPYEPSVYEAWYRDGNERTAPHCHDKYMRLKFNELSGQGAWAGCAPNQTFHCLCEQVSLIAKPVTTTVTPSSPADNEATPSSKIKDQDETKPSK